MASMLLRASRDAARAAPAAASVASRFAAVAAASNRLLRRFPIASRSFGRGLGSDRGGSPVAVPPLLNRPCPDPAKPVGKVEFVADAKDLESDVGKVEFVADAKDLESDEALWALYERWCKAFGEERDQDEMRRLFKNFKRTVFLVDRTNKEAIRDGRSVRLGINKFADGKHRELMTMTVPFLEFLRLPYTPNTKISGRVSNIPVEEEDLDPLA